MVFMLIPFTEMEENGVLILPKVDSKEIVLDILVEAMGRINFAQYMIDRKGITDRVTPKRYNPNELGNIFCYR